MPEVSIMDFSTVLGYGNQVIDFMFGGWSSAIEWLTTAGNELALIGLFAWLAVFAVGGLLRIIKL